MAFRNHVWRSDIMFGVQILCFAFRTCCRLFQQYAGSACEAPRGTTCDQSGELRAKSPGPVFGFLIKRLFGKRSASGRRHGPCGQGGAAVGACGQRAALSTCARVGPACPAGSTGRAVMRPGSRPERQRWQRRTTYRVRSKRRKTAWLLCTPRHL